jgi:hypothetical protein
MRLKVSPLYVDMHRSRRNYRPIEFDARGQPRWVIPIPRKPSLSPCGHALPFLHPKLKNAKPARWPVSHFFSFVIEVTIITPLGLLTEVALICLNRGRITPNTAGISGLLQRVSFWAATCYRGWYCEYDSIKAPIVFPGEVKALPVDAGMVEPVLALYALGLPVTRCYEGYGVTPGGVCLKEGFEFPQSLFDALDEAGTRYVQIGYDDQRWRELVAWSTDSDFTAVLRRWARKVCLQK